MSARALVFDIQNAPDISSKYCPAASSFASPCCSLVCDEPVASFNFCQTRVKLNHGCVRTCFILVPSRHKTGSDRHAPSAPVGYIQVSPVLKSYIDEGVLNVEWGIGERRVNSV